MSYYQTYKSKRNEPYHPVQKGTNSGVLADNRSRAVQRKISVLNGVIQLVAYNNLWSVEEAKYQADKVGSARLPGDAEWLAIVRYTKSIKPGAHDTVQDVLDKAEARKKVPFKDWKGSQAGGDAQEAQHLISSSYATKTLKWPYSFINSPHNGKMLLAGRRGKGAVAPKKYLSAKLSRGKKSARGLKHITRGIAHPRYDREMKRYINAYYKKNGLVIGKKISLTHMQAIAGVIRVAHKKHDGKTTSLGVDDLLLP